MPDSTPPVDHGDYAREVIGLLQEIERRSRRRPEELEARQGEQRAWEGILFSVLGVPVVASLEQVREILNIPPAMTRVPGTRRWMLGIANVRGNLLPVTDLQAFLGGEPIPIEKRSRVLVIEQKGFQSGLLVGDVRGLRHFNDQQQVDLPALPEALRPYVTRAFRIDDGTWPVFDMQRLAEGPAFQMAAL